MFRLPGSKTKEEGKEDLPETALTSLIKSLENTSSQIIEEDFSTASVKQILNYLIEKKEQLRHAEFKSSQWMQWFVLEKIFLKSNGDYNNL